MCRNEMRKISYVNETRYNFFFSSDIFSKRGRRRANIQINIRFISDDPGKPYAISFHIRLTSQSYNIRKVHLILQYFSFSLGDANASFPAKIKTLQVEQRAFP